MTTTALKAIDDYGGIDEYIMNLGHQIPFFLSFRSFPILIDDELVANSNTVTRIRGLIAASLFRQGALSQKMIRRMGFDHAPPPAQATPFDLSPAARGLDRHYSPPPKPHIRQKKSIQLKSTLISQTPQVKAQLTTLP